VICSVVQKIPQLHVTPLATLTVDGSEVIVEIDDVDEVRWSLRFAPYQAVRVTTADCFDLKSGEVRFAQRVLELVDSDWIRSLTDVLARTDISATFMCNARHFIIPAQDDFIEVVAWDIHCEQPPVAAGPN
jgi:hypothetical protein